MLAQCRAALCRARGGKATARCRPFRPMRKITATEVMVTVTAMLKAVNLQLFELGMWQDWSGKQVKV